MRVSIVFLLHLIGFGILTTSLLAGFILERKFRREEDFGLKLYTAGISRIIGLLSPIAAALMLLSGIGNIHNRYLGSVLSWYDEGWLVAKIVLFAILVVNGAVYGPRLIRQRLKLLRAQAEQSLPPNVHESVRSYNRQITLFYCIQTLLLVLILYLSVYGTAKHPGVI
jgi:hypothetical protein